MPVGSSVDKSLAELRNWGQTDPYGLADYSFALQAEVRRLRDAAAQNSTNSSAPPPSDRSESPKPKSLRKASGRKPGGQPGHPGRTLQWAPDPKHTDVHPLLECACGEDLSRQPAVDFEARQVFDLPSLTLECTEHRAEIKECPCCHARVTAPFPDDVKAPLQYGKNFRALLAYLYDAQQGASLRISQMCQEMFSYAVSEATLQAAREQLYDALAPFQERLREILPNEPGLGAAETRAPNKQRNHS